MIFTFHLSLKFEFFLTFADNEDSNQPARPRSLIRVFIVRMNKLCILGNPKCAQWRFWSDCANAQADLNLCWASMSEITLSVVVAHSGSREYCLQIKIRLLFRRKMLLTTEYKSLAGENIVRIGSLLTRIRFQVRSREVTELSVKYWYL